MSRINGRIAEKIRFLLLEKGIKDGGIVEWWRKNKWIGFANLSLKQKSTKYFMTKNHNNFKLCINLKLNSLKNYNRKMIKIFFNITNKHIWMGVEKEREKFFQKTKVAKGHYKQRNKQKMRSLSKNKQKNY